MKTHIVVLLLFVASSMPADEPVELTIHPQAIESPRLKYRLLPSEAELKPGNAVPILLRLPWEQIPYMTKVVPTLHEWDARPLDDPAWQSFPGTLPDHFYSEMKRAAFRRTAEWEYPIGEQSAYFILLPDVQGLRTFLGSALSAKVRYHVTRKEFTQARETILVALANGRHLAQTPFYVNQLIASAIYRSTLDRATELIAQPESPNLYWGFSGLSGSLLELERTADLEASAFAMTFPAVTDLDRPRDAAEWKKMADQLVETLEHLGELPAPQKGEEGTVLKQFLDRIAPPSAMGRTSFVKHGRAELAGLLKLTDEKVAAMSDDEVGIRWYAVERMRRDQRTAAVMVLPPREAWPELMALQADLAAFREKTGGKGQSFLDPTNVYVGLRSLQRKIAALRIIEAVRDHLAKHEGRLPETLAEIEGAPIPLDPLTDEPFAWKVTGESAILTAPALPEGVDQPGGTAKKTAALEYRLSLP
jgi:hypothetical protein